MLNSLILGYSDALILLARILLMTLFLITGWQKIRNFSGTAKYMASTGSPAPQLATAIAIGMEFFVGLALILGLWTRPLALLFFAFTLATAFMGHPYWKLAGAARHDNEINFYKNLSIMGGLLLLAVTGPGRYALMP